MKLQSRMVRLSSMSEATPADSTPSIFDAGAHPTIRDPNEIRQYMNEPLRSRAQFPGTKRHYYPSPKSEHVPDSNESKLLKHTFDDIGAERAILLPKTRGLLPDIELANEICGATNRWLSETWLDKDDRFLGSIRVNPQDPDHAVSEIERWAEHPQMVQVGVPTQSHQPYGQRRFHPIWEAAAGKQLPVAVHADDSTGVEFWPTYAGYPTYFIEFAVQYPITFSYHLMSLIVEGVFERIEDLVFVFADGGFDMLWPLILRSDKDWRGIRWETPWVTQFPSDYLQEHVRFCAHGFEGPTQAEDQAEWLQMESADKLLMFASNYPSLNAASPSDFDGLENEARNRILSGNAHDLYRLPEEHASPQQDDDTGALDTGAETTEKTPPTGSP